MESRLACSCCLSYESFVRGLAEQKPRHHWPHILVAPLMSLTVISRSSTSFSLLLRCQITRFPIKCKPSRALVYPRCLRRPPSSPTQPPTDSPDSCSPLLREQREISTTEMTAFTRRNGLWRRRHTSELPMRTGSDHEPS